MTPAPRGWVVSPAFDLLLLANVGWPLLLLPGVATAGGTPIDFWQLYYLTLPHRWITLVLVAADADRREDRGRTLAGVALLAGVVVAGAYLGSGTFLCLAMVDYVWNAWHFGSQHAGVLRLYSKKLGDGRPGLEKWGVRGFVTYGALRAAGWATGEIEPGSQVESVLHAADAVSLVVPIVLIARVLATFTRPAAGKLVYLGSVGLLYAGLILSLHFDWPPGVVTFAAAGSMFHAVEYLAVVTHYAWRRLTVGGGGAFRVLAASWIGFLGVYVLLLGSIGVWLARPEGGWAVAWQGANLWAAVRPLRLRRDDLEAPPAGDGGRPGGDSMNPSGYQRLLAATAAVLVPAAVGHLLAGESRTAAGLSASAVRLAAVICRPPRVGPAARATRRGVGRGEAGLPGRVAGDVDGGRVRRGRVGRLGRAGRDGPRGVRGGGLSPHAAATVRGGVDPGTTVVRSDRPAIGQQLVARRRGRGAWRSSRAVSTPMRPARPGPNRPANWLSENAWSGRGEP